MEHHRNPFLSFLFGGSSSTRPQRDTEVELETDNEMQDMPPLEPIDVDTSHQPHQDVDMAPPESVHPPAPRDLRARVEEIPDEEADDLVPPPPSSSSTSSAYTTAFATPNPSPSTLHMPGFQRSGTRRSRMDEDDDRERDRRHPSERVGSAAEALRNAVEGEMRRVADAGAGAGAGGDNDNSNSGTSGPFRFYRHLPPHGVGLGISTPNAIASSSNIPHAPSAPAQASDSPAPPAPNSAPNSPPQPQQQGGNVEDMHAQLAEAAARIVSNLFGGIAVQIELGPPRPAHDQPAPANPPADAPPAPAPAAAGGNPPAPAPATDEPPLAEPNPAHRPITILPQLLARLAAASQASMGMGIPFFIPLPFGQMDRETEDPERAKRFVRGLEEVPEGLVRRLERVGKLNEEGEGGCGDGGCAVCWDRLLDDEDGVEHEEGEHEEQDNGEEEGEHSDNDKTEKEKEEDAPLPKIVALPCAHVFHSRCLIPWFSKPRQTTCPTCRFNIDPEGLMKRTPPQPVEEEEVPTEPSTPVAEGAPGLEHGELPQNANAGAAAGTGATQLPGPGREFFSLGFGFDVIIANGPPPPNLGAGGNGGGVNMVFSLGPDGRIVSVPPPPQRDQGQGQQQAQNQNEQLEEGEHEEEMRDVDGDGNAQEEREGIDEYEVLERFLNVIRGGRGRATGGAATQPAGNTAPAPPAPAPAPAPQPQPQPQPQVQPQPPQPQAAPTPRRPRVSVLNGGFSMPFGGPGIQVATGAGRTMSEAIGALFGNLTPAGPLFARRDEQPQQPQQEQGQQQEMREEVTQPPQPQPQPQPQEAPAPAPADNANANANPEVGTNTREAAARLRNLRNMFGAFDIPLGPFGPHPRSRPAHSKKAWTLPPAPGPTLRQRIERKEREAGLRCSEISCGIGPSDDDPVVADAETALRQLSIYESGENGKPVCAHTFHSSCLVTAERVALDGENVPVVGEDVEVCCPVCKGVGCVSRRDWEEGVRALL